MSKFVLVLITVMLSSWYFFHTSQSNQIKVDKQKLSTMIDGVVTDLSVQQFNTEGQLVHSLQTPLMHHIQNQNINILHTPHIIVHQDTRTPWEINAQKATSIDGGKQITFSNQVVVRQKELEQNKDTTLLTDEIIYFPQQKLATTSKDVTMKQANNKVQATGMNVYLAENRVQLLSHARGQYVPEHG